RARVTHGGFSNRNAQQVWSGSGLFSSGSAVQDAAISISFNLGNLSPNQSTSFAYAYILSSADLNNALAATNINFNVNGTSYLTGNTASVCSGTGVPISLTNTGTFTTWNWSPSTGLNTTTGTNVVSTVTSPITYTVTGTGPCGSVTLSISLNPVNVPSVGNAGVISGPTSISLGQANNTFSISPVSNATGYTWTLPPGAVVVGSSTSNTITFNASNISWCGPITVTPFNSCYTGASSSKNICVGNQLTTGSIPTSLCPGQSISVNYTASGIFNAGNTFTAQLSNSSGSFATPTNIGSITSTALSGTITSSIPASIPVGTGYRIRIVSSNLVGVGSDNGANISIGGLPTITCGSNLNLSSDPGLCASLVTYAAPVATSPCTGSPTNLIVNGGFESGNLTGWVAVDNPVPFLPWQVQSSFSYFNTVTPIEGSKCAGNGFDGNTGVASLSQQVTLPSSGSSILSWKENLQYNIFSGYLPRTYEVRITNASGSILETLYSFTANAGISTNNAWVNQSFDVSAYNGQTVKIVFWQNIPQNYTGPGRFALDDVRLINTPSSATVIQTSGLPSGSLFPVGVTTNTFVATDLYGNTASCAFNVTISDNEDPVITCPNDISVLGSSAAGTVVSYDSPVVFDNCGLTTLIQSAGLNSGSLFPLGTTTNVFQTTDASGNTATCSFNVSVTGVPPSIVCPGTINSSTDPGQCSASVTFAATEVIGIPASTITYSASSGSNFNQGNTLVTATAVNAVGSSSCSFTINVTDNENPVVNCPANITLPTCIDQATWPLNASDNCGISSIVSVPASGSNFPVGITPVVITATDVNGNTSSCSFTVSRSAPLSVSAIVGNIACNGGTTSVTVSASGGTAPYTGVGTFTVSAGSYSYTVTDANGCTASTSATVTEPSVLTVGIVGSDYNGYGVSCYQSTDGSADATANGGVSGYSYSWSNGSTSEDLSGLAAGSYSVTVTDANGCSAGETVVLVEPTKVNISATNTAIACFGGNSTVTVTTWGGALQYQVNDAGTYSVPAGSYTYNVVDANGCSASTDITIGQPALLVASTSTSDYNGYGVSCNGGSNGEVMVSATGGTAPYSGTGNNAGLSAGSYSYTVTDANGCSSTVSATITEPSVLTVGIVGSDYNGYGVSCYQSTDGSADATA
ncbi:MAG: beta strand repeat-containing protein, partial [Flavobacteriales bacterium]